MSNEVILSKETLESLKCAFQINQTLKIAQNETVIKTTNAGHSKIAFMQIEEVFPRDVNIYDLREFISVVSIIQDPVLDLSNDKYVLVKSQDGKQRLRYFDANPSIVNSYFEKNLKIPEDSKQIEVAVTSQDLKMVMTAASAMKLELIGFRSESGNIVLTAFSRNNGDGSDANGFSIEVGETEEEFELLFPTEMFSILNDDCYFTISEKKIAKIETGNKIYWFALHKDSSFE